MIVSVLTLIEKSVFAEYLVNTNTFSKYLNTNANTFNFKSQMQIQTPEKIFKCN